MRKTSGKPVVLIVIARGDLRKKTNKHCYSLTKGHSVTICTVKKNAEAL